MKDKIINLLVTKNNKKEKMFNFSPSIISTAPWKHSSNEDIRYYMWLCQVQKWLIEDKDIYIYAVATGVKSEPVVKWANSLSVRDVNISNGREGLFDTYTEALENGIYRVLTNLIKENGRNNQKD